VVITEATGKQSPKAQPPSGIRKEWSSFHKCIWYVCSGLQKQ